MSIASTLPYLSVEEYLRTDYEPNCEYLDGALKPKALPDNIHSAFQLLLLMFITSQRQKFPKLKARAELHTRITPTRFRVPDVAGIVHTSHDGRYPDSEAPPVFTIEIASEREPWSDLRSKIVDHLAVGVGTCIIADPYTKTVLVATAKEPLRELSAPRVVRIPIPEYDQVLVMDFDDLYRQLDSELS